MTDWNGTTVEELIEWLNANAGSRAGVGAADGVISVFDTETGDSLGELKVDRHLTNDKVSLVFDGPKRQEAAEALYVQVVDGGLDQEIESRLNSGGLNVEIGEADNDTWTQRFTAK